MVGYWYFELFCSIPFNVLINFLSMQAVFVSSLRGKDTFNMESCVILDVAGVTTPKVTFRSSIAFATR